MSSISPMLFEPPVIPDTEETKGPFEVFMEDLFEGPFSAGFFPTLSAAQAIAEDEKPCGGRAYVRDYYGQIVYDTGPPPGYI